AARTQNTKTIAAHPRFARERLAAINDDAASRIIGRQGDGHLVAENHANAMLAQLSAEMGEHLMAVLELDAEISRGEHFDHAPLKLYVLFSTHRRREPYALCLDRSMMATPGNPTGSTDLTDGSPDGQALATPTA